MHARSSTRHGEDWRTQASSITWKLSVGAVIHLSALKLPAGVEVPELKLGPDHDVAVVVAKHARVEEEAPAAEGDEEKK